MIQFNIKFQNLGEMTRKGHEKIFLGDENLLNLDNR